MQAVTDFIETWEMRYEVASIGELKADATEMERKEHKAKVFRMCAFPGERLEVDRKDEDNLDTTAQKAADFDAMIKSFIMVISQLRIVYFYTTNFISLSRLVRKKLMI